MWIAARCSGKLPPLEPRKYGCFGDGFFYATRMGICGRAVDDVCIQLYESNQQFKYYNKIL
jgi:hypothetical protein